MDKTSPKNAVDQSHISAASLEKAQFAKTYIEMKYSKLKKEGDEKKDD